jgi:hypothetical protein
MQDGLIYVESTENTRERKGEFTSNLTSASDSND